MKIKLKDFTEKDYRNFVNYDCKNLDCETCPLKNVECEPSKEHCRLYHKDIFNEEFLNQEIEIADELTDSEATYLFFLIKPFRERVEYVIKLRHEATEEEEIFISLENDSITLPKFKIGKYYKGLRAFYKYTLEELGI